MSQNVTTTFRTQVEVFNATHHRAERLLDEISAITGASEECLAHSNELLAKIDRMLQLRFGD